MKDKKIKLTPGAIEAAKRLQQKSEFTNLPLRLYLEGKGCDGFYYGVTFDKSSKEDITFNQETISLVVDPQTLEFCWGSTIDWVDDERGQGFLVNNPMHRKYRGKFFKRKAWQEKLDPTQRGE